MWVKGTSVIMCTPFSLKDLGGGVAVESAPFDVLCDDFEGKNIATDGFRPLSDLGLGAMKTYEIWHVYKDHVDTNRLMKFSY